MTVQANERRSRGVSERTAIIELVHDGLLTKDIAAILDPFARDTEAVVYYPESAQFRLLVLAIDKSSSIERRGLTQAVIDVQHHLINSLLGATSAMKIAMGQLLFNEHVDRFQDIAPLRNASNPHRLHSATKLLDETTYVPSGGSAIYDALLECVTVMLPTLADACATGRRVWANVVVVTDGVDEHSRLKQKPEVVRQVLDYVQDNGLIDRITLVGIGPSDYRKASGRIGIRDVI